MNRTVTSVADLQASLSGTVPSVGHFYLQPVFDDQRLVIIQSVGSGRLSGSASSQLLEQVDQLGGTPEYLLAGLSGEHRYALVGAATNLPWHGTSSLESSTAMSSGTSPGQPIGAVTGELARGRDGLYVPAGGDPAGPTNTDLYRILYQPTVAWPFAGDPGLAYIADNIGLGGYTDVRSAYPNTLIDFAAKTGRLQGLDCTAGPDVCGPDFAALKIELLSEFDWVASVDQLASDLVAPYAEHGGSFDVQQVTDEILAGLPVPPDKTADMRWLTIMTGVMGIASKAAGAISPEASAVFGVIGSAGSLATYLMQTPVGGPADAVKAAAGQLSAQMNQQQTAYFEWVNEAQDLLVSDYGKLSAIGTAIGSGDPAWNWTGTTTNALITALDGGTRASAYTALLPIAWGGYNLRPGANLTASNDVTSYICDEPANYPAHRAPFAGSLPQNQLQAATSVSASGVQTNQVWTFANLDPPWTTFNDAWVSMPNSSVTDNIYGSKSTGPAGAYQYGPSWWRSTYNPPGHVTCQRGEGSMDVLQVWSQHYPPPQITPPLP